MNSVPFFEPDPFKGVLGQTLAKNRPKTTKHKPKMILFPRGFTATKWPAEALEHQLESIALHIRKVGPAPAWRPAAPPPEAFRRSDDVLPVRNPLGRIK